MDAFEDNLRESFLSFYHVGPGDLWQAPLLVKFPLALPSAFYTKKWSEHSHLRFLRSGSVSPVSRAVAKISSTFCLVSSGHSHHLLGHLSWHAPHSAPLIELFGQINNNYFYWYPISFFLVAVFRDPSEALPGKDSVVVCRG